MIEKTIHYCWFGGNPLPELAQKCIASWKKYCPDYKIVEWNEKNFNINENSYIQEAYKNKKYAFVADYARFKILNQYGGIYFDTDVEVVRSIPNDFLKYPAFLGCEEVGRANPGLIMASEPDHFFCKEMIDVYRKLSFYNADGSMNLVTIVDYTSNKLREHGWKGLNQVECVDGIMVFPVSYFCPKSVKDGKLRLTKESITIHHFDGSWYSKEGKKRAELQKKFNRVFGFWLGSKLLGSYYYIKKNGLKKTIVHTIDTVRGRK